jgi:hypothetical protein
MDYEKIRQNLDKSEEIYFFLEKLIKDKKDTIPIISTSLLIFAEDNKVDIEELIYFLNICLRTRSLQTLANESHKIIMENKNYEPKKRLHLVRPT